MTEYSTFSTTPTTDEAFQESFMLESEEKQGFDPRLPSSMRSASSLRRAASKISKTYKQASTLFLTRRLSESLSTLKPLITVLGPPDEVSSDDGALEPAPIANASRSSRIKVWSLYLTLLNSIIELGPEDGKAEFGGDVWRGIVSKARDATIWEEVVQVGYGGVEGDVDAEVVSNLATLLLAQAPSQKTNQQRLESFLSASLHTSLNDSTHFDPSNENDENANSRSLHAGSISNPRDLASRIKILELYTLHILPRNREWDYAREFILLSDILEEESREGFLRNLASLQDEEANHHDREQSLQRERDQELERRRHQWELKRAEEVPARQNEPQAAPSAPNHQRLDSEKDYGIDSPKPLNKPTRSSPSKPSRIPPNSSSSPSSYKKHPQTLGIYKQGLVIMRAIQHLISTTRRSISKNPLSMLRFVLFLLGLIAALSRRGVRDRLRRLAGEGWGKVRRTVGMGVKVSYM